ncbi:hypothetical protein RvY_04128 [Ramazzottius varieornatus]|uniref:Uncharacterized protein n=1 Tax=Ramazzottius varieornatus TaxID=947166 RepID=A0A1D1UU35_RAMVA|nr:hypothetical protein RvY_04128 [Ramazzottius varieornatus]
MERNPAGRALLVKRVLDSPKGALGMDGGCVENRKGNSQPDSRLFGSFVWALNKTTTELRLSFD